MNTEQLTARFEAAVRRYAAAERAWAMFGMPDDGILMDQLCAAEEEREKAREALLAHKRAEAGEANDE
jgi:hypothetical protein